MVVSEARVGFKLTVVSEDQIIDREVLNVKSDDPDISGIINLFSVCHTNPCELAHLSKIYHINSV